MNKKGKSDIVTMADIAKKAGVTKATISMSLANKPGISLKTRKKVLEIAKEMNYNLRIGYIAGKKISNGLMGFVLAGQVEQHVVPGEQPDYIFKMVDGAMSYSRRHGVSIAFSQVTWDQLENKDMPVVLQRQALDGIILRAYWKKNNIEELIKALNVPIVMIDCDRYVSEYSHVQTDTFKGMEKAVDHLIEKGCRNFATITGETCHINSRERLAGLHAALAKYNIFMNPENVSIKAYGATQGKEGVFELLERKVNFDALVCQSDDIAQGAIQGLQEKGIKIPLDVKVVGFDNMGYSANMEIPLTTIDPKPIEMGVAAADILSGIINGDREKNYSIRIEPELIIREST
jgi:LacI family transcriptional regulator, galactose operon repressor